jgi:hypothetical protein
LKFYEGTYQSFKKKAFADVLASCEKADTAFKVNPIRDKFGLLKIMAYARHNPTDTLGLVKSINDLVFKYPDSEVAEPAKNLLSYIQKGPFSTPGAGIRRVTTGAAATPDSTDVPYFTDDAATHFYVIILSGVNVDLGKLKFRLSNFNVEKFEEDFFEVASTVFDQELQIVTVKNFNNKKDGMNYYLAMTADNTVYEGMKETDYRHFIISKDNYTRLFRNKDVFEYYQFFRENYLTE